VPEGLASRGTQGRHRCLRQAGILEAAAAQYHASLADAAGNFGDGGRQAGVQRGGDGGGGYAGTEVGEGGFHGGLPVDDKGVVGVVRFADWQR
jgi:hypothetical protein